MSSILRAFSCARRPSDLPPPYSPPRRAHDYAPDPVGARSHEITETLSQAAVPVVLRARPDGMPQDVYKFAFINVEIIASRVGASLELLTVELTSKENILFHHTHVMGASIFRETQRAQDLAIDFVEYPAMLARIFDACIAESNCAVLTVGNDGVSQLHIVHPLHYSNIELLTVEFARSSEAVMDRYNALMRSKRRSRQGGCATVLRRAIRGGRPLTSSMRAATDSCRMRAREDVAAKADCAQRDKHADEQGDLAAI
jgi:hypothetical protein